jgi:hypothetical protein
MRILMGMMMMVCLHLEAQVNKYDVLINEIMPDPSPTVGLPNTEYIELKNVSNKPINLLKWKISNGTGTASINTGWVLQPDSLVIVCARTQVNNFDTSLGIIGVTSFPALLNESGTITLFAPDGQTIHAMAYDAGMHDNLVKEAGGWSLEMADPQQPCNPHNWFSSMDNKGGTPGRINSISKSSVSVPAIMAIDCIAQNETSLLLMLNQGADSISASLTANYHISPLAGIITGAEAIPPFFNQVKITLQAAILPDKIYTLTGKNIRHCSSTKADSITTRTSMLTVPEKSDVLINELLFNPESGGTDFVELVNVSNKVLNAKNLLLATQNNAGLTTAAFPASTKDRNFFPGDHLVFTADSAYLSKKWQVNNYHIIKTMAMPSLPDNKGNVSVLTKQGTMIDAFNYDEQMHFPLLNNREGVSLERISWFSATNDPDNWHSASSASGYGTPTRQNSQHRTTDINTAEINVLPAVISPDNNGTDDILGIHYQFNRNGNLLTCNLFNQQGVLLGKIINNALCGTSGILHWNGTIGNKIVRKGVYILLIDILSANGQSRKIKKMIAVQ